MQPLKALDLYNRVSWVFLIQSASPDPEAKTLNPTPST